ncbi:Hpt domain-containing protein [Rhodoferax aquaticus]|uniref:Chemotaxis protein CheA n=1 Tax=Rhodoferax aquaticus TaxID=2527691 RepID=A0A515ESQ0_9BURK|nr:Hpt domain-containing protein [Rhodoferax aquaticus]QDL55697.1 hybrid sensor histidine kinase/response regulator [Rhodoferax aquaticus]
MSSNPAAVGENEIAASDLGPLAWVLDELRKSLDGATKAMRRFVRDAELARGAELTDLDASHLRVARQQLHQAVGALEMVGLGAPAKVLRAMEALAQKFVQRPETCSDEAANKLERASFALTEYLEGLLKGKKASPVALFAQYRSVLELTDTDRVHPADLWPVEWRWLDVTVPETSALAYSSAVREKMDWAVLKVVKMGDNHSAARLSAVCHGLAMAGVDAHARTFWLVCAAYFEAVAMGLCPSDVYTKRAASRVLQQYAILARGGAAPSERLALDLLFFCSLAQPSMGTAPLLTAVRSAYGLDDSKFVDYEAAHFGRFDPALLVLARKRIAAASETWSALAGGDVNRLKAAGEQFTSVAESMVKLHPETHELSSALQRAIEFTIASSAAPTPAVAMEVATTILYLEAAYEDLDPTNSHMMERSTRLAQRMSGVVGGGVSEPMESWMEDLYRRVSDRQTMGSVVAELRTTLDEVEKSLDQFFRAPADKTPLQELPSRLAQMRGVFSVLGLDQPAIAALRMRTSVEQFLVDDIDEAAARLGIFEKLGNSLGAMGFLIDMLSYQRELAKRLFVYDESLGEFRPLMGRERVSVVPDVSTDQVHVGLEDTHLAARNDVNIDMLATVPFAVPSATVASKVMSPVVIDEDEDDTDLQDIFLEEAREVVLTGLASIEALRSDPADLEQQTVLRRAFHTLKGSSRMVGLTEFGEAAWSFEQLLNTWLAEQRPASEDLIAVATSGMTAFGLWVEDIASGDAGAWHSADFRKASDGLRLHNERIGVEAPRRVPTVSSPMELDVRLDPSGGDVAELEEDLAALELAANQFAEPHGELPDLELDFDQAEPVPEIPLELQLPEERSELVANQLAGAELAVSPSTRPNEPDSARDGFSPTQLASPDFADSHPPVTEFAATAPVDFEATQPFDLRANDVPVDLASAGTEVEEIDFGDFDFGTLDTPAEIPASAVLVEGIDFSSADTRADLDPVSSEPFDLAREVIEPDSEQGLPTQASVEQGAEEAAQVHEEPESAPEVLDERIKVIGPLRLSIPLYNVYLNEADEWSRRLQTELTEWSLELEQDLPDSAVVLAHSLLGSSATVGFTALSDMARLLEQALQHVQLHRQGTLEHAQVFNRSAEDIRRLLHQFAAGFLKDADVSIMQALQDIIDTEFLAPTMKVDIETIDDMPLDDVIQSLEQEQEQELELEQEQEQEQAIEAAIDESLIVATPALVDVPRVMAAAPLKFAEQGDDEIDAVDSLDDDLFPIFDEEATELLPQLGAALREWVDHPDHASARNSVLRVLHTLKGSARLAGAMRLGEMAHRMESSIEQLGAEQLQSVQLEPLLPRFDDIQRTFASLNTPVDEDEVTPAEVTEESVQASGQAKPARQILHAPIATSFAPIRQVSGQSVRVRSKLLDQMVAQAGEVLITRSRMDARMAQVRSSLVDLSGNLDRLRQQLRDVELQAESQMQSRLAQTKDSAQAFDPLEFDRFTRVQELTRMMAESVNDVATVQRNLQRSIEGNEDDLIAQGRQARELQRDLLRTRMVEFESISDRLYGVVRQASKDTAKQVKLDIVGGSIEMDRGVLDRMAPAFEHMLRNAIAHGIEDAEVRAAAGKPLAGTITIQVNQESNDISVAFSDDGSGLHLDKIRAKAIANGVIKQTDDLSDSDAANLIFTPGFSTADSVTELAGRGIGMDVVRSEVTALGGRIETTTTEGQGTRFKLVLPLTTAVTQVVILRMGEFTIGVPSNLIETVLRVPSKAVDAAYQSNSFEFGARTLPFFWAGALLQVSAMSKDEPLKTQAVAILRSAGQELALHVDEVLGNREVVVKNLGPQLARLPGLAGMSVLASGAVVLIYNPVALAAVYGEKAHEMRMQAQAANTAGAPVQQGQESAVWMGDSDKLPLVLVVDDSITVRRVTQRLLKREGYRVALAADGLQALEQLMEERPAVVLSDIEMPRMDGFDLARNIRNDERLRDLPIIMITSRIAGKHREHAKELGVDHYLGKPYSEDELLELVRGYCVVSAEG